MPDHPRHGAANETCPWSGKPVRPDGLTLYRGRVVGFCNPGCRDKFDAATARFDAALDQETGPTLLALAGVRSAPPSLEDAVLVVLDAQGEYRLGTLPLDGVDAALGRIAALLARARELGAPVLHVAHRGRPGGPFDRAGPGGAILDEAAPAPGEPVVEKGLPNAFAETDLRERVAAMGRGHLVLAGFMTHMCVAATARAALDSGLRATVAADATATRALPDPLGGAAVTAVEVQRATLAALADRIAAVVPVAAFGDGGGAPGYGR